MNRLLQILGAVAISLLAMPQLRAAEPLKVFIRAGAKTHGPGQHDHPRFLGDWTRLLGERGISVEGSMEFPTVEQLDRADVVVIYAADGMKITGGERARFEQFLQRGGGLVVLHDGVVAGDQHEWAKQVQGGSWRWDGDQKTTWHEGEVGLYFVDPENPITRGISNFDWNDEVYNQLDMSPDVNVLAVSFVDVFNIWPQIWTYEKTWPGGRAPYRAFVSLPGHQYEVFNTPHYRAILLRGLAWAGRRDNVDEFCTPEELASLRYPEGGPRRAAEAVKTLQLHPEFNITLAADETVAEKIMSLDWDPRGRLWVVETPEYPGGRDVNKNDFKAYWDRARNPERFPVGGKEPRKPRDRISILTDTTGDGVMDHKSVFADGLELPTSLVFYRDGVIVAQAPDILWIRDTNGDGTADKMETLYTGWGTFDTHAVINNFRWGPDGWIYGAVGYTRGRVKSGDGIRDFGDIAAGIYRFRPDGSMLEQIAAGGCNTWGCEVAPDGEIVFTTATCGEPICHVVIPEKALARGQIGGLKAYLNIIEENKIFPAFEEKRQPYVQIDWVGAWTAAAGSVIYDGGAWPAKWAPEDRYSFFMGEATRQLVHHEFLEPRGSTYQGRREDGRKQTHFLASTDYWFRPIHARVGPDGALYVVDFYNQIAVHNDTRGPAHGARNAATRPDRDHHFTRLWRIQHRDAAPLPPFQLDARDPAGLVPMLAHPNGWVRMTANRLLNETQPSNVTPALVGMMQSSPSRFGRIQALYTLNNLGALSDALLLAALRDTQGAVRKNAARIAAERPEAASEVLQALRILIQDPDGRARINALIALGSLPPSRETADAIVAAWPSFQDPWLESAAVGAVAADPLLFLQAAMEARNPGAVVRYVPHIARIAAQHADGASAARFVQLVAASPPAAGALRQAALDSFTAHLKPAVAAPSTADLEAALRTLLASEQTAGSVLPLVVRWDAAGGLADAVKPAVARAESQLADTRLGDDVRGQVAVNLVGVRALDPSIVPAVAALLGSTSSVPLQLRVIEALGSHPDTAVALVAAFPRLPPEAVEPAFGQIVKRGDTAGAFLDAVAARQVDLLQLGPVRQHRLRTHPDAAVAARANTIIDELKGPEAREKEALLARLTPEVLLPGDVANGARLYTENCAGCHVFKDEGRNLAPSLTGMGAHGPADLLIHIVDPNRLVEPNFVSTLILTADDQSYDGIIERENAQEVVLRNATGDYTLRKADIQSRASTGRSLMPEGFEQLGPDGLRDLLAYLCADENRYRMLDLSAAFTANTGRGLYNNPEATDETVVFRSHGLKRADDVPFDVVSPQKAVANVLVLRGGAPNSWSRKNLPQKVEVTVGVPASRLHFLGGVAGWGYPAVGDAQLPVLKVTLNFQGGGREEWIFRNGQEFADYIARVDVPKSRGLPDWTRRGQVRWHTREVQGTNVIESLTLESFDNGVAPTIFAITADNGPRETPQAEAPATRSPAVATLAAAPADALRILIVGGGSSHDFQRFFHLADAATLRELPGAVVAYTEDPDDIAAAAPYLDVLYLSNNQPILGAASREAVFRQAASGRGLLLVHAALWYSWSDWPEYNRDLVGGGSRSHDRFGEFEVTVHTDPQSPLTAGLPGSFRIHDELYHHVRNPEGVPPLVLATGRSPHDGREFPVVWLSQHREGRIACITLGHDGQAHSHPAYRQLLKQAALWAGGREPAN